MSILRNALTALKDAIPNRDNWEHGPGHFPTHYFGICGNLAEYYYNAKCEEIDADKAENDLNDLIHRFNEETNSKYLFSHIYPVGGEEEYCTEQQEGTLWYNPRRLAMLDWLLEHCE